ncbi:winged helix-turn-helix domain-containing protein [Frigidibacter sp. RF13]|uniref:winged helix-turn-helix domain-containing tetratricopeptide repeat protein n=1 Tax=Frigidibacter sp. RF13 TaxID=2997340 RepID=UPI00226EAA08|nr:winged helix-turn-helix domain-containing protein [Frigidibacter sp. RF13]MCY1125484.1 winged helix-turn-helix domain-containing protein [Frigidibacter sp. RF13]
MSKLRLNDAVLDIAAGTLTRGGNVIPLRAKSYQLLTCLAARPGQVVTKDELMAAVWPDVYVTEDSLTQTIRDIRTAVNDEGARLIQTVRGRGYLLDISTNPQIQSAAPDVRQLPRLAILPFAMPPEAQDMRFRADMLREDVAGGLSRFKTLRMISNGSSSVVAKESGDPDVIAQRLDADYLVEGNVYPAPQGFQLRLTLTSTAARTMIWSDLFDCTGAALLDASGEIAGRIVGRLFAGLEQEAMARANSRATANLTAYDHFARGYVLWTTDAPDMVGVAREHFLAATQADPEFAVAWTYLAWTEVSANDYGAASQEVFARALEYARTGLRLAPSEARTLSGLGYIQALMRDFAAAEANIRSGLAINPFSADTLLDFALVNICRGRPMEALRALDRMRELDPMRVGMEPHLRGEALYMVGRYAEAVEVFARTPDLPGRRRAFLAAAFAMAGREDEAVAQLQIAARNEEEEHFLALARACYRYENKSDDAHFEEGLKKAVAAWHAARPTGF